MNSPKGYTVFSEENKIKSVLYKTLIVVIANEFITLNSGGWKTMHTKKCMNLSLAKSGYRVFQRKGLWYVEDMLRSDEMPFSDGMVLNNYARKAA